MKKESVNKFDLEAAFKALNEIDTPVVKGLKPRRENLQERFTKKLTTDILVEDYFDVNDSSELEAAQEEREAEIAKAKLARIEKIVDLDAESEEDLLPSYVGKMIIQCPQCMTLFYKNEADIEKSEENPDVVNVNETCQHCGNTSGYTLIGKVDKVGEEEAENYDIDDFDENELNLDFDAEEPAEEESTEEEQPVEEESAEEGNEEELELEPVEETEEENSEEEEEVKESLTLNEDINTNELDTVLNKYVKQEHKQKVKDELLRVRNCWTKLSEDDKESWYDSDGTIGYFFDSEDAVNFGVEVFIDELSKEEIHGEVFTTLVDFCCPQEEIKEALTEAVDKELDDKLKAHNDYIEYLKDMIEKEEKTLANAKNEFVKKSIQSRIDALKADLEAALPEALKGEIETELPTPEDVELEATENNDEKKEETKESLAESLTEAVKLIADLSDYEPWSGAVNTWKQIQDADKVSDLGTMLEDIYPDGLTMTELNDILWFDADWVLSSLGIIEEVEESLNEETTTLDMPKVKSPARNKTERLTKALAQHPLFNGISDRIIQRYLIPLYQETDPNAPLEVEAIADYFKNDVGLGKVIMDNIDDLTENQVKNLAKNDPVFIEAVKKFLIDTDIMSRESTPTINTLVKDLWFALGKDANPEEGEVFDPTDEFYIDFKNELFDIYNKMAGQNVTEAVENKGEPLTEANDEGLDILLDSEEFKKPISDAEVKSIIARNESLEEDVEPGIESELAIQNVIDTWESVEEIDEESLDKLTESYLTEVYSNVKSFKTVDCALEENKLVVEGTITFNSGKVIPTTFIWEAIEISNDKMVLEGLNTDFSAKKAFILNCNLDAANRLVVESLKYKYTINNTLVEGLLK